MAIYTAAILKSDGTPNEVLTGTKTFTFNNPSTLAYFIFETDRISGLYNSSSPKNAEGIYTAFADSQQAATSASITFNSSPFHPNGSFYVNEIKFETIGEGAGTLITSANAISSSITGTFSGSAGTYTNVLSSTSNVTASLVISDPTGSVLSDITITGQSGYFFVGDVITFPSSSIGATTGDGGDISFTLISDDIIPTTNTPTTIYVNSGSTAVNTSTNIVDSFNSSSSISPYNTSISEIAALSSTTDITLTYTGSNGLTGNNQFIISGSVTSSFSGGTNQNSDGDMNGFVSSSYMFVITIPTGVSSFAFTPSITVAESSSKLRGTGEFTLTIT